MRRKGIKPSEKTDVDSLWKMASGDAMHELIVERAKEARIYIGDEVEFLDEEHNISGRVDLFILHPEKKRIIGVEIKSIGGYHQVKSIIEPSYGRKPQPKREHVMQAGVYLAFFAEKQNIHEWCLAYVDRESGKRKDFSLTLSDRKSILVDGEESGIFPEQIYARFKELEDYLKHDMVPEREFELQYTMPKLLRLANAGELSKDHTEKVKKGKQVEKGDWQCSFCQFKSLCWNPEEKV